MTAPNRRKRILVIEDDSNFRETLALEFEERGYRVTTAGSLPSYRALEQTNFDYAVVDLKLGRESGLTILAELLAAYPNCRVVIMTGYGSIATAVKAVKLGAHDYLAKPTSVAAIERAFLADSKHAHERAIPIPYDDPPSLARHEREYIEHVLEQCDGNISEAARRLGLHRQSLQRKLRKYPPSK
jgi:two-component system response regulator RegA